MSVNFDLLKSSIDDLDFKLSGSPWTIGGSLNVPCIKEESVIEFENIYQSVIELSIMKKDFPIDVNEGSVAIDENSGDAFVVSRILPEIDGQLTVWIKPSA